MSTLSTPSTSVRWVFATTAEAGLPSRPSDDIHLHSGRERSIRRATTLPTNSRSCSMVPGRGNAERRTWKVRSKLVVHPDRGRQPGQRRGPAGDSGYVRDPVADEGDQSLVVQSVGLGFEDVHGGDVRGAWAVSSTSSDTSSGVSRCGIALPPSRSLGESTNPHANPTEACQ